MQAYVRELIDAGTLVSDATAEDALRRVAPDSYRQLHDGRPASFAFLSELPIPAVLAFVRAISIAERKKLCPYPGSVSLLIPAFFACRSREAEEVAAIADWVVANHENPYTPFNFLRTRGYWEAARRVSASPVETLRRVREMELEEERAKVDRAKRHEVTEGINRLQKGESPDSPGLRERMLREMERKILEE